MHGLCYYNNIALSSPLNIFFLDIVIAMIVLCKYDTSAFPFSLFFCFKNCCFCYMREQRKYGNGVFSSFFFWFCLFLLLLLLSTWCSNSGDFLYHIFSRYSEISLGIHPLDWGDGGDSGSGGDKGGGGGGGGGCSSSSTGREKGGKQTDRQTDRQRERGRDGRTDRQTDGGTDGRTDGRTDGLKDRQTDTDRHRQRQRGKEKLHPLPYVMSPRRP